MRFRLLLLLGTAGVPAAGAAAAAGLLFLGGAPAEYAPAAVHTLSVTLQEPGKRRWGCELTALDGAGADRFTLVTRVRMPKGNFFPPGGWITTDTLVLAQGQTGSVLLDKPIKDTAPLGTHRLQVLEGHPPATVLDLDSFQFQLVP